MASILLKGGSVVNPENGSIRKRDVWIENGRVIEISISRSIRHVADKWEVIDCEGLWVAPGLIDMHVHARTPGQEQKETLATMSMAALAGGFTSVVCMANTEPAIDNPEILHQLLIRAENESLVKVCQVAALTRQIKGQHMNDLKLLLDAGAIALSDDGNAGQHPDLLQAATVLCHKADRPLLFFHCQDTLYDTYDKRSEYLYIYYLLKFAEAYGCWVHIQHVSCLESVALIREAKARHAKVTCETAPHYIALTQGDFKRIGVNAMMNPPLRGKADRLAILEGLDDGTIDVIATDHAPHTREDKEKDKRFGIIGLETAVPVVFTYLRQYLTVPEIIAKMTTIPARILGLEQKGQIKEGWPADITIIDPKMRKVLKAEDLKSKSRNSPWLGKRLQTWPVLTIRDGKIMMRDGKIII